MAQELDRLVQEYEERFQTTPSGWSFTSEEEMIAALKEALQTDTPLPLLDPEKVQ